jgi:hypothetical protein
MLFDSPDSPVLLSIFPLGSFNTVKDAIDCGADEEPERDQEDGIDRAKIKTVKQSDNVSHIQPLLYAFDGLARSAFWHCDTVCDWVYIALQYGQRYTMPFTFIPMR